MLHRSVWRPGSAQTRRERLQRSAGPSWIKDNGEGRAANAEGRKGGQERGKEGTEKEGRRRVERRRKGAVQGDLEMNLPWEGRALSRPFRCSGYAHGYISGTVTHGGTDSVIRVTRRSVNGSSDRPTSSNGAVWRLV